jgi:nucleoside-diphosphate-sugar epimerase
VSRVLVTGAGGFIGTSLCRFLSDRGFDVVAGMRDETVSVGTYPIVRIGNLGDMSVLADAVAGVDFIVHLAARVHIMSETTSDPLAEFRRANVEGTRLLAQAAGRAGVKRLVFLSSVKVNGERTDGAPFTEDDPPAPADPYGVSKWEAEQALGEVAAADGLETVILRCPLVYGPGVRANFLKLLKLCDNALPLPVGAITGNRRSLIYLDNLTDAIHCALTHEAAAGRRYLVRDRDDVSTAELVRRIRAALGRPGRLVPVPSGCLGAVLKLAGKRPVADRVLGSLAVDDARIGRELGWTPPFTMLDGLTATIAWYRGIENRQ